MYKTIKTLEMIGQNTSINQFETAQEMLLQEGISEEDIDNLVNSNIPLICAWVPDDDKRNKEHEDDDDEEEKDKKKKKDHH
jgi:hypothetical protein